MGEINQKQDPNASSKYTTGNGTHSQSHKADQGAAATANNTKPRGEPTNRKSTGPRTVQGKQRSKLNAVKYGLFSKSVLLEWESRAEFDSLLKGLQEHFQPQGTLEAALVENLAVLLWRKRRLLKAESAVISEKREFMLSDSLANQFVEAWDCSRAAVASGGMLRYSHNLVVVRTAKDMLVLIQQGIGKPGFEEDSLVFKKLYGEDQDRGTPYGLRLYYEIVKTSAKESGERGDKTGEEMHRKKMRQMVDEEIGRLSKLEQILILEKCHRIERKSAAAIIPSQEVSDHLLRCEAHLSREFDRALNQLERVQRMRKGQPLAPRFDFNINN